MNVVREIAVFGKALHDNRMVIGAGGNISARDGEFLVIKKRGADMSRGNRHDYLRISFPEAETYAMNPFSGAYRRDLSSETPLHIACYRTRTDIGAVMHVHDPFMVSVAEKVALIGDISYEFECVIGGNVPRIEYIKPGTGALAEAVSNKISKGANAVLLRKHGAITVGKDLEEAYLRVLALHRACIVCLNTI
ncbi:MAG: class II aldolase/adducin family protein [Candidatus Omnitrophica bacterium]|nr:class II aldolase/adducin family protein [Candidatus Omnitrophota bacterium]MDD5488186.1 class II aldolase/adducin family protein [Candidatus Omnitrophota bacterium]